MDKMSFASYKFKPSDVIEGLNRYFAETKAFRYRRVPLEIWNGEVKPGNYYVIRDIVFDVSIPKIRGYGDYYIICDPDEVVGVAINWLREKHDIFYTPGMGVPVEDVDVDEAAKENKKLKKKAAEQQKKIDSYEATLSKITDIMEPKYAGLAWSETWDDLVERIKRMKENLDVVPVAKVREALGMAEDDAYESDIFQCIKYRNNQLETLRTELVEARRMHHNSIEERNKFGRRLADIRKAAGMSDDDHGDLVEYIETLLKSEEEYEYLYKQYERMYCELRDAKFTKLNDHITELELTKDLWELRRNAIEDLKSRGFCFRPEENETLPEIYDKLLKGYDWAYGSYKDQYRLRQMWHVRWESENERANGVQKALDREREVCRVKDISLETAKKQYEKVCGNLETAECALNGMKSKVRELREEKTKVITALGQDIWDDCLK